MSLMLHANVNCLEGGMSFSLEGIVICMTEVCRSTPYFPIACNDSGT